MHYSPTKDGSVYNVHCVQCVYLYDIYNRQRDPCANYYVATVRPFGFFVSFSVVNASFKYTLCLCFLHGSPVITYYSDYRSISGIAGLRYTRGYRNPLQSPIHVVRRTAHVYAAVIRNMYVLLVLANDFSTNIIAKNVYANNARSYEQ